MPAATPLIPASDNTTRVVLKQAKGKFRDLRCWHFWAGLLHFVAGAVLGLVYFLGDYNRAEAKIVRTVFDRTAVKSEEVASFDPAWLLLFVAAVTALEHCFHIWALYTCKTVKEQLTRGINLQRWFFYSLSATGMTAVLFFLSGGVDLFALIALILAGVSLQWHGYIFELMQNWAPTQKKTLWTERNAAMISGFVLFAAIPAVLFTATGAASSDLPWFVWVALAGTMFNYLQFALVQLFYFNKWRVFCSREPFIKDWFQYERAFIILSFVAKLFLLVIVFSGLFTFEPTQ
jgi:hypothetical protein